MSAVSVIMPLYNAERYVLTAIRSVLEQTWRDLELIVVDDASTDGSAAVVESIADGRLRFIRHSQNEGAAAARNLAIAQASGEWLCFLDADDIAMPRRIETQVRWLESNSGVAVLGTATTAIDENGTPLEIPMLPLVAAERIPSMLLFRNCLSQSSVLMRRSDDLRFDSQFTPAEDYDLWVRMAAGGTRFAVLPEACVRYRVHPGAVSRRHEERMRESVLAIQMRAIRALGVEPDEAAHSVAEKPSVHTTPELLARAGRWLEVLRDANLRRGIYDRKAFERVLEERWFQVCIDAFPLGAEAWKIYRACSLATPRDVKRQAIFLRRILPQMIRRK